MSNRPKVLMFAPAFAPDLFSEALVNSKLAIAMIQAGWELIVVTTGNHQTGYHSEWTDPWLPLKAVRHEVDTNNLGKIPKAIAVTKGIFRSGHPVGSMLWAISAADHALALHKEAPFDFILTRSTSCIAHLPAMVFRRHVQIPWVANWNDPPEHRFPPPYPQPAYTPALWFKDRYLRAAARSADVNTFPSEALRQFMFKYLQLSAESPSAVIPHPGLSLLHEPAATNRGTFRIAHAGNLSSPRNPREFLAALSRLITRHPEAAIEFELIGTRSADFEQVVREYGLADRVTVTGNLPYLACQSHLAQANLLLLVEAPCEEGIFLPSKLVDYIETDRPVLSISPAEGALKTLNIDYEFGAVVSHDSAGELDVALEAMFTRWQEGHLFVDQSRLRGDMSADRVLETLLKIVSDIRR